MSHRVASRATADQDDIWHCVAKETGSLEIAGRLIDSITSRFFLLATHPHFGRTHDDDFGVGSRNFSVAEPRHNLLVENGDVLILRVVHGRRDIEGLFGL